MSEIVYVFTNEAMPELVKIGRTANSVVERLTDLSRSTAIPLAFECYFAAEVENAAALEKKLHELFSEFRINPKREFFKVDPEKIVLAISIGQYKEITPAMAEVDADEQEALEKAKARRPRLKLSAIGIMAGDQLQFSRDETIVATVVGDGELSLDGDILSPSAAALKLLKNIGYKTPTASGSEYWKFQGELLDERRRRLESERFDEPGPT